MKNLRVLLLTLSLGLTLAVLSIFLGAHKADADSVLLLAKAPLPFLRVATVNNGLVNPGLNISGSQNTFAFRGAVLVAQDCARLVFSFNNWGQNNSGQFNNGNNVSILDVAIDTGTAASQVTFAGLNTATLLDGASDFQSDPISPLPGKTRFHSGEIYYIKMKMSAPAAGHVPYAVQSAGFYTGTQAWLYDPAATTVSSAVTPGIFTSTGTVPANQGAYYMPIVLGYCYADNPSFLAVGDSIINGVGDTATNLLAGEGYFQRGLTDLDGISNPHPAINFSVPGTGAAAWSTFTNNWINFIKYTNYTYNELITNDAGTSAVTFDALADLQRSIIAVFQKGGSKRIIRSKPIAVTTSTDSFATTANQTPQINWGPGGSVAQTTLWIANELAAGRFQAVVPSASVLDGTIPTDWAVNGTANFNTADGKHPTSVGHTTLGTAWRSVIATLPNVDPTPSALPPVLDPNNINSALVLSNGNLTVTHAGSTQTQQGFGTTGAKAGKFYWEVLYTGASFALGVGNLAANVVTGSSLNSVQLVTNGHVFVNGADQGAVVSPPASGDRIRLAVDYDNRLFSISVNGGNWNGNVANDPAVGATSWSALPLGPVYYPNYQIGFTPNSLTFAFSGFTYSVPAGYSALTGGGV